MICITTALICSVGQLSIQMPHERNMSNGGQGHGKWLEEESGAEPSSSLLASQLLMAATSECFHSGSLASIYYRQVLIKMKCTVLRTDGNWMSFRDTVKEVSDGVWRFLFKLGLSEAEKVLGFLGVQDKVMKKIKFNERLFKLQLYWHSRFYFTVLRHVSVNRVGPTHTTWH